MEEKDRLKLIKKRREEQRKKELEYSLNKDLTLEENQQILDSHKYKNTNPIVIKALLFFGTLVPLYVLFFLTQYLISRFLGTALSMLNVNLGWLVPIAHGLIWIAAVFSVYRKRSIIDDFLT